MLFGRTPGLPTPEQALQGRPQPVFSVPDRHTVLGTPLLGPYPEGYQMADFGLGCFWGAERTFWQLPAGCLDDPRRLPGRPHRAPDLRGGLLGPHRPHRGRPRGLRPRTDLLRAPPEDLLGVPRPHPGLPPGQRRRHPVPLRDLHPHPEADGCRRGLPRVLPAGPDELGLRHQQHRRSPASSSVAFFRPPPGPRTRPNGP